MIAFPCKIYKYSGLVSQNLLCPLYMRLGAGTSPKDLSLLCVATLILMASNKVTVYKQWKKCHTYLFSIMYYPGPGWDISIREMAIAAIKLEILSAAPNNEVSIMGLQLVLNMQNVSSEYKLPTVIL